MSDNWVVVMAPHYDLLSSTGFGIRHILLPTSSPLAAQALPSSSSCHRELTVWKLSRHRQALTSSREARAYATVPSPLPLTMARSGFKASSADCICFCTVLIYLFIYSQLDSSSRLPPFPLSASSAPRPSTQGSLSRFNNSWMFGLLP